MFLVYIAKGLLSTALQQHRQDSGSHYDVLGGAGFFGAIALLCLLKAFGVTDRLAVRGRRRLYLYGCLSLVILVLLIPPLVPQDRATASPALVNVTQQDLPAGFVLANDYAVPFAMAVTNGLLPSVEQNPAGLYLSHIDASHVPPNTSPGMSSTIVSYSDTQSAQQVYREFRSFILSLKPEPPLVLGALGDAHFGFAESDDSATEDDTIAFCRGPYFVVVGANGKKGPATEARALGIALSIDSHIQHAP